MLGLFDVGLYVASCYGKLQLFGQSLRTPAAWVGESVHQSTLKTHQTPSTGGFGGCLSPVRGTEVEVEVEVERGGVSRGGVSEPRQRMGEGWQQNLTGRYSPPVSSEQCEANHGWTERADGEEDHELAAERRT
ncbi:unnamed protein product [Boreogadus saida]